VCEHALVAEPTRKVHVATVRKQYKDRVYETHLLRRSYRDAGQVKSETLANLSSLPRHTIELIRRSLAGESLFAVGQLESLRSLPHGHVVAVLGTIRRLGLIEILDRRPSRQRDLCVAMLAMRLLEPGSKLATTRSWNQSTLATEVGVVEADEDELYAALDWLLERQQRIESALASRHLHDGSVVLYDLSSSYVEGRRCTLAKLGYSRDRRRGTLQVEYGVVTDAEGRPIAVSVVAGNTGDPATVAEQVEKVQQRFGLRDVVLVGDRGMLTSARIEALREVGGVAWVSSLRSPQVRALVDDGTLQLGIFDTRNLAEITHPAYPDERLVVCKNPDLAVERARKREDLLVATEAVVAKVVSAVDAGRLRGAAAIGLRLGQVLDRYKMAKHFELEVADDHLVVRRKLAEIGAEAALDGIYVLRTSVVAEKLPAAEVVRTYKSLSAVERAFRTVKSIDMQVRPIHHYAENRVRAHILLCLLAYYVRWHMERAWAPMLFRDDQPLTREDPVAPARRSPAALHKASTQLLDDGTAVHSFRTLLKELSTLARDRVAPVGAPEAAFDLVTKPTPVQARALTLLGLPTSATT
jgi:DDE family transposase